MTATLETPPTRVRTALPGARMLRRALWLIIVTCLSAFFYGFVLVASKGGGVGPEVFVDANGNHLDANGEPTNATPTVVNVVMHANSALFVLLAVLALAAIVLVLRRARSEDAAVRILTWAMWAVAAVAVAAVVVGYVWFMRTPLDYWTQSGIHFTGFPFASVTVTTQPDVP